MGFCYEDTPSFSFVRAFNESSDHLPVFYEGGRLEREENESWVEFRFPFAGVPE